MISLAKTLFPPFIIMLMNLLKSKERNNHFTSLTEQMILSCNELLLFVFLLLPYDWIAQWGAGHSTSSRLDGSDQFELALLLLLITQLCLWSPVGLPVEVWLQIVRVVSAPSHQEHPSNNRRVKRAEELLISLCV